MRSDHQIGLPIEREPMTQSLYSIALKCGRNRAGREIMTTNIAA